MKALVTGGAGFIGSHLCERLIKFGYQVICIDNLSTGQASNIKHLQKNKKFKFIKDTIQNLTLMKKLVSQVDIIYHMAAVVGVSNVLKNPVEGIHINGQASSLLIDLAYSAKKIFVFASSSEVYGKNTKSLLNESDYSIFGPSSISRWSYAIAKLLDEHLILSYTLKGFKGLVLRYFNVYGPHCYNPVYSNVIPKFISQALEDEPITVYGDGRQIRSFTFVDDVVEATILIPKNKKSFGKVVNIGREEPISILKLAQIIKMSTNSKSKITFKTFQPNFEDPKKRVPDIGLLRKLTGFKSKINLEEGLERTIKWFKNETR